MIQKAQSIKRIVQQGQTDGLVDLVKERWDSELVSFGLRRDLTIPFTVPDASMPLRVRPLREDDIPNILGMKAATITDEGREERLTRRRILDAGIDKCYVAVTSDDTPCYMQWLIGPSENRKVQTYFKG